MSHNAMSITEAQQSVLPREMHAADLLDLVAVVLGNRTIEIRDQKDSMVVMRAHHALDEQFARGKKRGFDQGFGEGYNAALRDLEQHAEADAKAAIARYSTR
jgi:hypothetical protein